MPGSFAAAELKLARRAEKEWLFDNPILIREQNYLAYLAWLMYRSNYSSYWFLSLFRIFRLSLFYTRVNLLRH